MGRPVGGDHHRPILVDQPAVPAGSLRATSHELNPTTLAQPHNWASALGEFFGLHFPLRIHGFGYGVPLSD